MQGRRPHMVARTCLDGRRSPQLTNIYIPPAPCVETATRFARGQGRKTLREWRRVRAARAHPDGTAPDTINLPPVLMCSRFRSRQNCNICRMHLGPILCSINRFGSGANPICEILRYLSKFSGYIRLVTLAVNFRNTTVRRGSDWGLIRGSRRSAVYA